MDTIESIKPDKVMDTRGLTPPMPLIKTRKALGRMKKGMILEIWCADPDLKTALPKLENENGCEYLGCALDPNGYTRYLVRK